LHSSLRDSAPGSYTVAIMAEYKRMGPAQFHWICCKLFPDLAAYFYAIETGDRPKAANRVSKRPQGVGKHLLHLEEKLKDRLNGATLIDWDKKKQVIPTEVGLLLFNYVQDVFNRTDAMLEEFHRMQYGNQIRVASIHAAWAAYGKLWEEAFKRTASDASIDPQIIGGDRYNERIAIEVLEGRAEIGITSYPPKVPYPFTAQPLQDQELRLVFRSDYPNLPKQNTVRLTDVLLDDHQLRVAIHSPTLAAPLAEEIRNYLQHRPIFQWGTAIHGVNIAELKDAVISFANTCSILPADAVAQEINNGTFKAYSLDPEPPRWKWGVIYRANTSRPAVKAFIDCLHPWFK
jgi:DNA-binding transcriptional LysR family regulator